MTTSASAHDGSTSGVDAGLLGALAGVTPVVMFAVWIAISGWGGTGTTLLVATGELAIAAVVAGWIVARWVGQSMPRQLLGIILFGLVGRLIVLPLDIVGSLFEEWRSGQTTSLGGIVVAAGGYLLYGLVAAIYTTLYLVPFGIGWLATFVLLRRVAER